MARLYGILHSLAEHIHERFGQQEDVSKPHLIAEQVLGSKLFEIDQIVMNRAWDAWDQHDPTEIFNEINDGEMFTPFDITAFEITGGDQGAAFIYNPNMNLLVTIHDSKYTDDREHYIIHLMESFEFNIENGTLGFRRNVNPTLIVYDGRSHEALPKSLLDPKFIDDVQNDVDTNISTYSQNLLSLLYIISRPASFIIQITSSQRRNHRVNRLTAAQRAQQQPKYVIKEDTEVKRLYENVTGSTGTKSPHIRRGHWRYYNNDRFVNVQGHRIKIRQTYVGGRRNFGDDNRHYKVIVR